MIKKLIQELENSEASRNKLMDMRRRVDAHINYEAHKFTDAEKEWRKNNKRWINAMIKNNPAEPTLENE